MSIHKKAEHVLDYYKHLDEMTQRVLEEFYEHTQELYKLADVLDLDVFELSQLDTPSGPLNNLKENLLDAIHEAWRVVEDKLSNRNERGQATFIDEDGKTRSTFDKGSFGSQEDSMINKLIHLADELDSLGLKKHADVLDQIIARAAREEDFEDLTKLFDEPLQLPVGEDRGPGGEKLNIEEPEFIAAEEVSEQPVAVIPEPKGDLTPKQKRLLELKRRMQLLKLKSVKKDLEKIEEGADEEEESSDEVKLPVATPADLKAFEDEEDDEDVAVNEASDCMCPETFPNPCASCLKEDEGETLDEELEMLLSGDEPGEVLSLADDGSLFDMLKEKLKSSAPELLKNIIMIVKDNPELLELLAL